MVRKTLNGWKWLNDKFMEIVTLKGWMGIPFFGSVIGIIAINNPDASTLDYLAGDSGWVSPITNHITDLPTGVSGFFNAMATDYTSIISASTPALQGAFMQASASSATAAVLAPLTAGLLPIFGVVGAVYGIHKINDFITKPSKEEETPAPAPA